MRKLIAAIAVVSGLALAGCQTVALPSLNLNTTVSLNTVYGIENAFGVAVNAANAYKALPLCRTGTEPGVANICAKRSVVERLQSAMRKARLAVNNLVALQRAYPSVDITNALAAAQSALMVVQQILVSGA
ncbi:hypothetical protein NB311A_12574 [Nitrobacter sp. Nb-311A]|uniref:hypothetical protein n=1 Tax=unclassified Nitrobacter TaxID=2620411 RepID=UPI0000684CB3|nr:MULTISPECIES: hypothetical protein [unclassified Nitrobacter]EAQ35657.1 hypothetical protein NB311A_12574 [Nitrobacter sp. Nb-311A]MCB1391991.1 hypothetical protein [Nitrobacter sp.]MCV0385685.1 hypothetical protein [Nitrobacter sp.]